MNPHALKARQAFASDERGAVAILFGLMFMSLVFIVGMAVDYARTTYAQSRIASAADTAALAAGRAMLDGRLSDTDIKALALAFFNENIGRVASIATINSVNFVLDRAAGGVTVNIDADVPMTFTRVGNFTELAIPVEAATAYEQKDIELAMALDITGSMGGQKIADLKAASKDLIDILLPDAGSPNNVRIGLAPYSASVNAGGYAALVSGGTSTDNCVRERTGLQKYSDLAPGPGAYYAAGGSPRDIDPTEGLQGYFCPSAPIQPLTATKSVLKNAIDGFRASGATGGHMGTQWAWNLISPEWRTVWPARSQPVAYSTPKTMKAIVLMTDGIFNMAYANDKSSKQALEICGNMKAKNVVVYTIGFQAPRDAATMLKSCATDADHFFNASNGQELRQAFLEIGGQLNTLRLTQ